MSNVYAIYDSYDDLCPRCGGVRLTDAIEDPVNDAEQCQHCGEWVHVSDWIVPEPHTVMPASETWSVAGAVFVWLAEHVEPGHWIDFVRDYTFVACVQTGTPVGKELHEKIMGWE